MASGVTIPIKYKFLSVMLLVLISALGVFLFIAQQTFSDDKKLFIMDSNRTLLKAATSEIKLELKSRLEELQTFIPRVYMGGTDKLDPFQGLSRNLPEELIGVTFLRTTATGTSVLKEFTNLALATKQKLGEDILKKLNAAHPIVQSEIDKSQGVELLNRSIRLPNGQEVAVLSFVLGASFLNDEGAKELIIVVDYSQTFLMRTLAQSELTEVFLLFGSGSVLSHPKLKTTTDYARKMFPHPIVDKMKDRKFTRESLEAEVDGEAYLCNVSETGFKNVFAVSQIRRSEAFLALKTLLEKSVLLAVLILSAATIVSVFFASGLTKNIQKLRHAAEQLGKGNLDVQLSVTSNDEIRSVARSFQWMAKQIQNLIEESTEKARLEDELETARLVQSTLLTPPTVQSDAVEMDSYYLAATECGGDYWDARITGNLVTVFIGDATGHGAPAAIVTAVAKSCFATLSSVYEETPLAPEQLLRELNRIIYASCRGKLLMTMCIIQLNLETGELLIANAGHESPLCLRGTALSLESDSADKKRKTKVEVFFSRGERLGFTPDASYEVERAQMNVGDTILLYTDGISEGKSEAGKEWGERALKKSFGSAEGLPLNRIKQAITSQFDEFTQGAVQEDDVTFVLFRWTQQMAASTRQEERVDLAQEETASASHAAAVPPPPPPPVPPIEAIAVVAPPPEVASPIPSPKAPPGGFAKKNPPPVPVKKAGATGSFNESAELREALLSGMVDGAEEDLPAPEKKKPKAA